MMKRILSLMMILMLLALPAQAESDPYALIREVLYRIVLRTEAEDVTLGSGVLFTGQDVLLTVESCCAQGDLYAIGEDGEHAVSTWEKVGDDGLVLMTLAEPSSAQPVTLANYDAQSLPYVFGADASGGIGAAPMYNVLYAMYGGKRALQLSGSEGMLPGAIMADEKGQLVGLVVTQQMEGVGMYVALEPDTIYTAVTGERITGDFLPVKASWNGGLLTLTWTDGARDSGMYIITFSGEENSYYTSFEVEKGKKSFEMAVPAGHTYHYQVQWAESAAKARELDWGALDSYTVPEAELIQFGFRQQCYLASAPKGQEVTRLLPEMEFISADTLSDENTGLYFQVIASYEITASLEMPMTVSLAAPDGQFYFEEMLFTFSTENMANDTFIVSLDSLFASCRDFSGMGSLPEGEYLLQYTIAGRVAGEYPFTVHPAGTAAPEPSAEPAPADTGMVSGLKVTHENGLITVDWADAQIPEGMAVTAYILYDGNTYYTFNETTAGSTSTAFPSIPGVGCMVWAAYAPQGNPNMVPESREQCVILGAEPEVPYTRNDFRNVRSGVAFSTDASAADKALYLPEVPLTRELLTGDGHLYFQTEDTYTVAEESDDHTLAIIFHTPEGMHFMTAGGYTFSPELNGSDLWLLDITGLFESYESLVHTQPWPAGEYTVSYCIDGQIVSEFNFTLE